MKKRVFLMLLLSLLCLSLLTATAFAAGMAFSDVKSGDWFYKDVKTAYEDGLINGKTDTSFDPNASLTYAEAAKLAACMNQRYNTGSVTLQNGSPWYQSYVDYCYQQQIIPRGKTYVWGDTATRAGYMEIFANALPAAALKATNEIADGAIPDVAKTHPQAAGIYKLYRAGILQGADAAHNCNPGSSIKRSEVAAILTRMMYPAERISFTIGEVVDPLKIKTQPVDVTAAIDDKVTFTVAASGGTTPYTYQWQYRYKSGGSYGSWQTDFAGWGTGDKTAKLSFKAVTQDFEYGYQYRCIVTDAKGNAVTSAAVCVVKKAVATTPLQIKSQPETVTAAVNDPVSFSVVAEGGTAPYTYQWKYRYNSGSGYCDWRTDFGSWGKGVDTNKLSMNVSSADFNWKYQYCCQVTDAAGNTVTSAVGYVMEKTAAAPLSIASQPKSITATRGATASFFVTPAGGTAPYKYYWHMISATDGKDYGVAEGSTYGGVNSSKMTVNVSSLLSSGNQYYCIVYDATNAKVNSSKATLTIQEAAVSPLTITTQPEGVKVNLGDKVTFTVAASGGTTPYTYQWQCRYKNNGSYSSWKDITESWATGANTNKLSFTASQSDFIQEYVYRCVITDANGTSVTSNGALVTESVSYEPLTVKTLTTSIKGAYVGQPVTFKVEASGGTAPYTYQWEYRFKTGGSYSEWVEISPDATWATGANTPTLSFKVEQADINNSYVYRCVVTDAHGNIQTSAGLGIYEQTSF